jgi:hypothetical protein
MATYRPISLIACFPKICEILIYLQTIQHIEYHNILVCKQFGFRKGLSLDSATYRLIEIIFYAWNNGKCIAGVFCRLTKSLDFVNHVPLFKKLEFCGV